MLVIRQEQIEAIIKGKREDFVNYLFGYLKVNHAEAVKKRDDKTLREMIRGGIKRAESHQIERVEDTKAFLSKMFEIAPNFDEQSEIKAVLDDETIAPAERIRKLESPLITEAVWEQAKNNYNEKAWFPKRQKTKTLK